jgi:diaminopimelate epimerase
VTGQELEVEAETLEFTKIHGLGNDFIVIEDFQAKLETEELSELAEEYCRRNFGIGANDILYIASSEEADAEMRIFEPDGTEADMCGNGIRCVAHYLYQNGFDFPLDIETQAGIRTIERTSGLYRVDMGCCSFARSEFTAEESEEPLLQEEIEVGGEVFEISGVNTGEPHLVVIQEDISETDVSELGRRIRNAYFVPESGANVNFVEIISEDRIRIRTYERGVEEETLACGTGATASAIISHRLREMDLPITVETRGGEVEIDRDGNQAIMTGPAETIYSGEILIDVVGGINE